MRSWTADEIWSLVLIITMVLLLITALTLVILAALGVLNYGRLYVVRLCDGTVITLRDVSCEMTSRGAVFCRGVGGDRAFGCVLELRRVEEE